MLCKVQSVTIVKWKDLSYLILFQSLPYFNLPNLMILCSVWDCWIKIIIMVKLGWIALAHLLLSSNSSAISSMMSPLVFCCGNCKAAKTWRRLERPLIIKLSGEGTTSASPILSWWPPLEPERALRVPTRDLDVLASNRRPNQPKAIELGSVLFCF